MPLDPALMDAWGVVRSGLRLNDDGLPAPVTRTVWSTNLETLLTPATDWIKTSRVGQHILWHEDLANNVVKKQTVFRRRISS